MLIRTYVESIYENTRNKTIRKFLSESILIYAAYNYVSYFDNIQVRRLTEISCQI